MAVIVFPFAVIVVVVVVVVVGSSFHCSREQ